MNLFVYGTLMYPEIQELVCGRRPESREGEIEGYEIFVVKGAEFPAIVRSEHNKTVKGMVLMNLSDEETAMFDRYEDKFYVRTSTEAVLDETAERLSVDVYEVPESMAGDLLSDRIWTKDWFEENHYQKFVDRIKGLK